MKIIIFGALGIEKTTFGKSMSAKLERTFSDTNGYYW